MDVACSGAGKDDVSSVEASDGPEPVHVADLYALGVVFKTFLAPVLITERFIDRFTWLLILFKLRTGLTEIALKIADVCLS